MMSPINTRRWHRHQVDLPVSIIALNGILTTPVPARASEISRAGMALHAPVDLNPGDVMHIQFPTSSASPRVKALVRNRRGQCLGLEFLTQLPPDSEPKERSRLIPVPPVRPVPELREPVPDFYNSKTVFSQLRRKQEELKQLQREIDALNMAILLLADDENEISRAVSLIDSIPRRSH
jgi:hypothetical protein